MTSVIDEKSNMASKIKVVEPFYVDIEVQMSFSKNHTSVLCYKVPVLDLKQVKKMICEILNIDWDSCLTLFVYRREESIFKKSSRVNYKFYHRIELQRYHGKSKKFVPLPDHLLGLHDNNDKKPRVSGFRRDIDLFNLE